MKWTPEMDRRLLAGIKAGRSRREIGDELGVSKNAASYRYDQLMGIKRARSPDYRDPEKERIRARIRDRKRGAIEKAKNAAIRAAMEKREARVMKAVTALVRFGWPLHSAVRFARSKKVRASAIAAHLNIFQKQVERILYPTRRSQ